MPKIALLMSKNEVRLELLKFIKDNLLDERIELTEDTDLHNVAGIDSMAMVEIILFIERRFNVTFSDQELNPALFNSVDVLAEAIVTHA